MARRGSIEGDACKAVGAGFFCRGFVPVPLQSPKKVLTGGSLVVVVGLTLPIALSVLFVGIKRKIVCCNKSSTSSSSQDKNELPVGSPVVDGDVEII